MNVAQLNFFVKFDLSLVIRGKWVCVVDILLL